MTGMFVKYLYQFRKKKKKFEARLCDTYKIFLTYKNLTVSGYLLFLAKYSMLNSVLFTIVKFKKKKLREHHVS